LINAWRFEDHDKTPPVCCYKSYDRPVCDYSPSACFAARKFTYESLALYLDYYDGCHFVILLMDALSALLIELYGDRRFGEPKIANDGSPP
jgi:hypothetical protein